VLELVSCLRHSFVVFLAYPALSRFDHPSKSKPDLLGAPASRDACWAKLGRAYSAFGRRYSVMPLRKFSRSAKRT
jgi:hypothetical protein